jgi:hypothetical protein
VATGNWQKDKRSKTKENSIMMRTKYLTGLILIISTVLTRCVDNNDTAPPVVEFLPDTVKTVQEVKALYADQLALNYQLRIPVEIVRGWSLRGIITASDKKDGNLYKEAFIQDATGGLRLLFEATSGLYTGDSVIVNLKGLYIGDYGDFWQVGGEPYVDAGGSTRVSGMNMDKQILKLSINNPTFPDTITITQAKSAAYLGKLVTLKDVQFADDAVNQTYGDLSEATPASANRDLMDCDKKKIIVRSSGYASFAGDTITDLKGMITGIVTIFSSDYQLIIRDFKEVKLTDDRCMPGVPDLGTPVETISQDFSGLSNNAEVLLTGWQNIAQYGDRTWQAKYYGGNTYAQATGYNSSLSNMVTWLITRPVTISAQKVLSFETAQAYWAHTGTRQPFQVFYSTNYTGKNLLTCTWIPISAILATKTDTEHTFISSGSINLPVEDGKSCVIAFKYTGSETESTTYRIDNILVTTAK